MEPVGVERLAAAKLNDAEDCNEGARGELGEFPYERKGELVWGVFVGVIVCSEYGKRHAKGAVAVVDVFWVRHSSASSSEGLEHFGVGHGKV